MTDSMPPAPTEPPAPTAPPPTAPPPAAPPPMAPPPMTPPPMAAAPVARPTGATVISIIDGILGVLLLLGGLLIMVGAGVIGGLLGTAGDVENAQGLGAVLAGLGFVFGIIIILVGALYLAIAYGVWKGRGWSWMLGVVVSIIALVFAVLGLAGGVTVSSILSVALPALVLYFFWQPDVKRWLGRPA